MRSTSLLVAVLLLLGAASLARAEDDVTPTEPLPAATQRRIQGWITDLAKLEDWQGGLSPSTGGGVGFAPAFEGMYRVDREKPANHAYRALVAAGPDAIPFLLAHLDDRTETKLALAFEGGFGGMHLSLELEANPTAWEEIAAIRTAISDYAADDDEYPWRHEIAIDAHTITVGDACFSILGEITNRSYETVRYQPTAITVVNSPTRDSRLARAVRAQWLGKDYRRELFRRLDHDLRTKPTGLWRAAEGELQAGALLRLSWYFPTQTAPRVLAILQGLDPDIIELGTDPTTGLDLEPLIRMVRDVEDPAVRQELASLLYRVRDPMTLTHLLKAFPTRDDAKLLAHLKAAIAEAAEGRAHHPTGFATMNLLLAIHKRWPEQEAETLVWHFKEHGFRAVLDLVAICYERDVAIPLEIWIYLLDVRAKATSWERLGTPAPLERLRVCDVAALQIAKRRGDLPFTEEAEVEARDERIERMREVLAKEGLR